MEYKNILFNFNSNSYYTMTSLSDNTNPVFHKFNQPSMPDWSYPNDTCLSPNIINKIGLIIISTLHKVNGDTPLQSHFITTLPTFSFVYSLLRSLYRRQIWLR